MITLQTELKKINGISAKFLTTLKKLGIVTVRELLWHFPSRYEDFSRVVKIAELENGQTATVQGIVQDVSVRRSYRRNMYIIEALIADETGEIKAVWFNQPFIARALRIGSAVNFAGKVTLGDDDLQLSSPTYEVLHSDADIKHTAGLIPVYPETKGLTSKGIRFLVKPLLKVIPSIRDFIPHEVLTHNGLPDLNTAIHTIHFPDSIERAEQAKKRFSFEDIFLLQLNNLKIRYTLAQEQAPPLSIDEAAHSAMIASLPFELTNSQKRSLDEIIENLKQTRPMNRLLQGDVGSGKTVIAALAALLAAKNNKQTAFMAPTEVLARQHYKTLQTIFNNAGVHIGLLTSSEARIFYGDCVEKKKTKKELLSEVEDGTIGILIGTHALIVAGSKKKPVLFRDLALAIVDEQHRFGVEQRAALVRQEKERGEETTIHFLSMSATPIPRTLSLALFGDLDLSTIDELPQGRKEIITKIVAPQDRPKAYDFMRNQVKEGRQIFVIYPRIDAVDREELLAKQKKAHSAGSGQAKLSAHQLLWADAKAVTEGYEKLSKKIFPELRVAMLHGRLKSTEKEQIMRSFAAGEIDILVSTSVVEVGVDIPNATIMMIESVERFGLSQLYQFRGRVGRGKHQSYCFLLTDSKSESVQERLNALLKARNGFELAEQDLALRGPGQFLGDKQTGLPDRAMDALNDLALIRNTRAAAETIISKDPELTKYPRLRAKLNSFNKQVHLE